MLTLTSHSTGTQPELYNTPVIWWPWQSSNPKQIFNSLHNFFDYQLIWRLLYHYVDCLLKDELLGLVEDAEADLVFKNQNIDMDVLYRTGENHQVQWHIALLELKNGYAWNKY